MINEVSKERKKKLDQGRKEGHFECEEGIKKKKVR